MDNGTASKDSMSDDSNDNSDDLEDASTEDVSFNPVTMKDQLVFECLGMIVLKLFYFG